MPLNPLSPSQVRRPVSSERISLDDLLDVLLEDDEVDMTAILEILDETENTQPKPKKPRKKKKKNSVTKFEVAAKKLRYMR